MISCRVAEKHMLELVRGSASDAMRLALEGHLEACVTCRRDRARWNLIEVVKGYSQPALGATAERRIVANLIASGGQSQSAQPRARAWPMLVGSAAAAALLVVVGAFAMHRSGRAPGISTVSDGETLEAKASGSLSFGGARVAYQAGTALTFRTKERTVLMAKGVLDIDVTPGLPGRFRVHTAHFLVEVLGTRFIVDDHSVRTLRGKVRILDVHERELAVLTAGHSWTLPIEPGATAPSEPAAKMGTVEPAQPDAPAVQQPEATVREKHVASRHGAVKEWLNRAKLALAEGDADAARSLVSRALAANPTDGETASAGLLVAESHLVKKEPDDAIGAYRRVLRKHPGLPEGEIAAFAMAQLLLERGRQHEAQAALHDYIARYPMGRFVREAREHLTEFRGSE